MNEAKKSPSKSASLQKGNRLSILRKPKFQIHLKPLSLKSGGGLYIVQANKLSLTLLISYWPNEVKTKPKGVFLRLLLRALIISVQENKTRLNCPLYHSDATQRRLPHEQIPNIH